MTKDKKAEILEFSRISAFLDDLRGIRTPDPFPVKEVFSR